MLIKFHQLTILLVLNSSKLLTTIFFLYKGQKNALKYRKNTLLHAGFAFNFIKKSINQTYR